MILDVREKNISLFHWPFAEYLSYPTDNEIVQATQQTKLFVLSALLLQAKSESSNPLLLQEAR